MISVLTTGKAFELWAQLREANLDRVSDAVQVGGIEQLGFGPAARQDMPVACQQRNLLKRDLGGLAEQVGGVELAGGASLDELAMQPEGVEVVGVRRSYQPVDDLELFGTISQNGQQVSQTVLMAVAETAMCARGAGQSSKPDHTHQDHGGVDRAGPGYRPRPGVNQGPTTAVGVFTRFNNLGSRHATAGKQVDRVSQNALLRSSVLSGVDPCLSLSQADPTSSLACAHPTSPPTNPVRSRYTSGRENDDTGEGHAGVKLRSAGERSAVATRMP